MALGRAYVSRLLRTCVQFWASGQGASMSSAIQSARMEFNSSGVMADPGLCSCPGLRTVMQRSCRVQRVGASASCAWAAASCTSCRRRLESGRGFVAAVVAVAAAAFSYTTLIHTTWRE